VSAEPRNARRGSRTVIKRHQETEFPLPLPRLPPPAKHEWSRRSIVCVSRGLSLFNRSRRANVPNSRPLRFRQIRSRYVHIGCFLISSSRARSLDCRFFKTDRGDVIRSRTWKSRSRANHDAEQRKSNGFVHECSKCYLGSKRGFPRAAGPQRALFMHTAHRVYPRYARARARASFYSRIWGH